MNAGGGEGSLTAYDPSRPFATASLRFATLLQHSVLSRLNAAGLGRPSRATSPRRARCPAR
jgi:hypothetical protein